MRQLSIIAAAPLLIPCGAAQELAELTASDAAARDLFGQEPGWPVGLSLTVDSVFDGLGWESVPSDTSRSLHLRKS